MRIALFLAFAAAELYGQDWPQFRGPNAAGVSADTNLPAAFGPQKNVVWKTSLPPGNSSPAVAGERIYLTAVENEKLFTIALDRATGKILWRELQEQEDQKTVPARPQPVA
jgi:outer membrane protein assembly factor BamB